MQTNAFASPTNPGYVYYDVILLNIFDGINTFADDFILAHETGHQVQFDNPSQSYQPGTKLFELQADCLAGTYFGHLKFTNPAFMPGDAVGIALGVCGIGLAENLGWATTADHGTCEQRAGAFAIGYLAAFTAYSNQQPFNPLATCR